jgi:Ser/Thr protein kinase RdoA (MazF antagonist)
VKLFSKLGEAEQKAWFLEQAEIALSAMGMPDSKLEWLSFKHHAVFNVNYQEQEFVLKIFEREAEAINEVAVLNALARQGKAVPQILQTTKLLSLYEHVAVLMEKVKGAEKTTAQVSALDMENVGKCLASLHSSTYSSKASLRKLDFQALFSDKGIFPLDESTKAIFSLQQVNVMDTVTLLVKSAMDELRQDENGFGLIHGDWILKNILFHEGEVRAIDFEYSGWGCYHYDLGTLLWHLKPLANYRELEEALCKGYCSVRPLPERHRQLLETFIAGQHVAGLRFLADDQHNPVYEGKEQEILQQRTIELQGFLETGILKRS